MHGSIVSPSCCLAKFSLSAIIAGVAILGSANAASAQTCLKDEYGKNVQCTANDVRVAFADNPRGLDGTPKLTCEAGKTFSFVADFHVVTTATARENIGLYFATGGQGQARTGTCGDNIISPLHKAANPNDVVTLGSGGYYENTSVDQAGDTCGDITTATNNQVVTVEVDNALCQAAPGTNQVSLPNCTSWQQPGGTLLCQSSSPNWAWVPAAIPGSPSKCNCDDTFTVPITVQTPGVTVTKQCTTNTTGTSSTKCDAGPEGADLVTYTVSVTNSSNIGSLTLDQICDSAYGNIATASGYSPACPTTGTIGSPTNSYCALPQTLGPAGGGSDTYTCTFTATQGELKDVKDTITANGVGSDGKTPFSGPSNQIEVTTSDAPSTATTTKGFVSTKDACFTVRYSVDVKNTSSADENITMSALTDSKFGDITSLHSNGSVGDNSLVSVLGTTCGVKDGLGTMAGTGNGAGVLGSIATGVTYSCQFDALYCGPLGTITNVCSNGVQHTNLVTPTLTGDEGEAVSNTGGSLTVNECVTTTEQ